MVRNVRQRVQVFDLMNSEAVQENERILEQGPQKSDKHEQPAVQPNDIAQENVPSVQQPEPEHQPSENTPAPTDAKTPDDDPQTETESETVQPKTTRSTRKSLFGSSPLKSEKGVKVMLPMDYYFKLVRLKECSGKTLQELAAQGVMEFIDKYVK